MVVVVFTFWLLRLGAAMVNVVRIALVNVRAVRVHISPLCSHKDGISSALGNCGIENTISISVYCPVAGIFDRGIEGSDVGVRVV